LDYADDILEPTAYPLITDNHFINKKILIIDDDALVLKAMHGFMTPWGCKIITATSIKAALNSLANLAVIPDLIISDYSLGNHETGIDAIKKIRRYCEKNIPAFLMSGNSDTEKISEAHNAGFTLLSKPIQPMIIRSLVAQYLTY
jgi:CheY-like chemotaxis protein